MERDLLLGIDLGTSRLKSVLLDSVGNIRATSGCDYELKHPNPGWAEQDPESWWQAAVTSISSVLDQVGSDRDKVRCISISCQAPALLPVDRNGNPLFPALIWMDTRAHEQCEKLKSNGIQEGIARINGNSIDPYYLAPKILWLKQHYPEIYEETYSFLLANGFIVNRLTGKFAMDITHGPLTLLFDSNRLTWSSELCGAMGISRDKLPAVLRPTEVVGGISEDAARITGLKSGIPVIAGCVDTSAALITNGVLEWGQGYFSIGTGSNFGVCVPQPKSPPGLSTFPHALPDRWVINAVMSSTGGAFRWCRDEVVEGTISAGRLLGSDPYDLMSSMAAKEPPGSKGVIFLPYLNGEYAPIWDPDARGVFFGLGFDTHKSQLVRSVMEGCAYALNHNIEMLRDVGVKVEELMVSGGPARSHVWNQIWSDVTGLRIIVPEVSESAPIGSAILAGLSCGIWGDVKMALELVVKEKKVYEPIEKNHVIYSKYYQIYRQLYPRLRNEFHTLAQVKAECIDA